MYRGNKQEKYPKRRKKANKRIGILILSLLLIAAAAIGGTMAYLTADTPQVVNTFTPAEVTTDIDEDFDGRAKTRIEVENTGDIAAYIRVKLVTYRVNDEKQPIGGTAEIPTFTLGTNWVEHEGYYYYTLPVDPNESTQNLIGSGSEIELKNYSTDPNDPDGGRQVIEVMAEAIQSEPVEAVADAWGVTIKNGVVSSVSAD